MNAYRHQWHPGGIELVILRSRAIQISANRLRHLSRHVGGMSSSAAIKRDHFSKAQIGMALSLAIALDGSPVAMANSAPIKPNVLKRGQYYALQIKDDGTKKCDLIDRFGNFLIPPRFTEFKKFDSVGLAHVREGNFWGLMGRRGKWVVRPAFEMIATGSITFFGNDQSDAQEQKNAGLYHVLSNKKWGVIDGEGHFVLPLVFDSINWFNDLGIGVAERGGQAGFVNRSGEWIGDRDTPMVSHPNHIWRRHGNVLWFYTDKGHYEIYDHNGRKVNSVSLEDNDHYKTEEELAFNVGENDTLSAMKDGKWGVIGADGAWLVSPEFERFPNYQVGIALPAKSDGKWGLYQPGKGWLVKPQFYGVGRFSDNGLAAAFDLKTKLGGYIDREGKWAIPPQFQAMGGFGSGHEAVVVRGDGYGHTLAGLIDQKGTLLIPIRFRSVSSFDDRGMALVKTDRDSQWIDRDGKQVFKTRFTDAWPFDGENMALARDGKKWGWIGRDGNWIIPAKFDDIYEPYNYRSHRRFPDGFDASRTAIVQFEGRWGSIDRKGNWAMKPKYQVWEQCEPYPQPAAEQPPATPVTPKPQQRPR